MSVSQIDSFATIARAYCDWAEVPSHVPAEAEVTIALSLLGSLYIAALSLPEGEPGEGEIESTSNDEWRGIYLRFGALPIDRYFEVFNPLEEPPNNEPLSTSLGDDLADIHRDPRRGFVRYERGEKLAAAWEWSFHFRAHWGHHLVGALSALHAWWSEHYFEEIAEAPAAE